MSNLDGVIRLLKAFGLTGNESRIYLSLLSNNPATGYEISRMAGVPRSAVYAVLGRLEELNLVNGSGRKPRHFTPIPPQSLIDHLGQKTQRDLSDLTQAFSSLESGNHDIDFWQIKGYDNVILKARETVAKARKNLIMSIWRREFLLLEDAVREAIARGVRVTLFSFTSLPKLDATIISYDLDEAHLRDAWQASLIMVADHEIALMGGASRKADNQAVWTSAPSITQPAINHIILDITLAGQRLGLDINAIVAPIMGSLKSDLDALLHEAHPYISLGSS